MGYVVGQVYMQQCVASLDEVVSVLNAHFQTNVTATTYYYTKNNGGVLELWQYTRPATNTYQYALSPPTCPTVGDYPYYAFSPTTLNTTQVSWALFAGIVMTLTFKVVVKGVYMVLEALE